MLVCSSELVKVVVEDMGRFFKSSTTNATLLAEKNLREVGDICTWQTYTTSSRCCIENRRPYLSLSGVFPKEKEKEKREPWIVTSWKLKVVKAQTSPCVIVPSGVLVAFRDIAIRGVAFSLDMKPRTSSLSPLLQFGFTFGSGGTNRIKIDSMVDSLKLGTL